MLLLLGTIGPSINLHYCDGKVFDFSILHKAKACCGGHCPKCKDVTALYKLKDNFEKQSIKIASPLASDFVVLAAENICMSLSVFSVHSFTSTQPPPLNRTSSAFTMVFRN